MKTINLHSCNINSTTYIDVTFGDHYSTGSDTVSSRAAQQINYQIQSSKLSPRGSSGAASSWQWRFCGNIIRLAGIV